MLPAVVPNTNVYYFTWNAAYEADAPVTRIQDVAVTLLDAFQRLPDQVLSPLSLKISLC